MNYFLDLACGNPGAISVLMQSLEKSLTCDMWMKIESIEGLRGSYIWMLYKDKCGQGIMKMYKWLVRYLASDDKFDVREWLDGTIGGDMFGV